MSLNDKVEYSCKDCDRHNEESDVRHLIWLSGWNACEEEHKKQVAELKKWIKIRYDYFDKLIGERELPDKLETIDDYKLAMLYQSCSFYQILNNKIDEVL